MLRFIPCFLPGIVAYILSKRAVRHGPWLLFAAVGAGILLLPVIAVAQVPRLPFLWVFCMLLGFTIPLCREIASPILARCSKIAATYSYGIYLTHTVIIGVAFQGFAAAPALVQIAIFIVLMTAFPYLAYRFVESPGIALGRRLAAKMRGAGAAAIA